MGYFFFKTRKELVGELHELKKRLLNAQEKIDGFDNKVSEIESDFRRRNNDARLSYEITLESKDNEITKLQDSFKTSVDAAVAQERKALKEKIERQDKEHAERTKRLELEHQAKISKCEKDLETDKSSYRKWFKTEYDSKVENLEKENARLIKENVTLTAEINAAKVANGIIAGQLDSVSDLNAGLSKTLDKVVTGLSEGIVKGLPTMTAEFTTPENQIIIPGVSATKQENKVNGEQKKS